MSLLNYEVHINVTDHHNFALKLKNACATFGWTVQTWEANKAWAALGGGVYGWAAGTEDFLEVRSAGFGAQAMQFRLRLEHTGTLTNRWLQLGAFYGTLGYDTANATHPVTRATGAIANWNSYRYFGVSSDVMPTVWFFGNEKVVLWVIKYDQTYVQVGGFGSLDLIDSAETQGFWAGYIQTSNTLEWYDKTVSNCFDFLNLCTRWNSIVLTDNTDVKLSYRGAAGKYNPGTDTFLGYSRIASVENRYSTIRPLAPKQDIWIKDSADSKWFMLGHHWIYRIQHEGLLIGQELTYGAEKYLAFPWRVVDTDTQGFAVRIL
jgi:hypothetical protein